MELPVHFSTHSSMVVNLSLGNANVGPLLYSKQYLYFVVTVPVKQINSCVYDYQGHILHKIELIHLTSFPFTQPFSTLTLNKNGQSRCKYAKYIVLGSFKSYF